MVRTVSISNLKKKHITMSLGLTFPSTGPGDLPLQLDTQAFVNQSKPAFQVFRRADTKRRHLARGSAVGRPKRSRRVARSEGTRGPKEPR